MALQEERNIVGVKSPQWKSRTIKLDTMIAQPMVGGADAEYILSSPARSRDSWDRPDGDLGSEGLLSR
jgi:hypothetical protein